MDVQNWKGHFKVEASSPDFTVNAASLPLSVRCVESGNLVSESFSHSNSVAENVQPIDVNTAAKI